jgi:hypothetical protein
VAARHTGVSIGNREEHSVFFQRNMVDCHLIAHVSLPTKLEVGVNVLTVPAEPESFLMEGLWWHCCQSTLGSQLEAPLG